MISYSRTTIRDACNPAWVYGSFVWDIEAILTELRKLHPDWQYANTVGKYHYFKIQTNL